MSLPLLFVASLLPMMAAASSPATPEDDDDEEAEIESILITATRTGNLVRDEPIRVEVVPQEEV
jgi:hypothetical protein